MTAIMLSAALAPLLLALAVAGGRRPERVLLPLYAVAAPFGSGASLPLGLPKEFTSISSLLLLLLLAALGGQVVLLGSQARLPITSIPVWLGMLGLLVATAAWSVDSSRTLLALPIIASLITLFCLVSQRRITDEQVRVVGNGALVGGIAAAFYGIYGALTGTLQTADTTSPRFGSDLLGANHTAAALMLPVAIALWRCFGARSAKRRLGYLCVVGLIVVAIALTGSRGGILALAATYATVSLHARRPAPALVGGAFLAAALLAASLYGAAGIGARETESSSGRLDIWKIGLSACQDYCLQGSGWGTFPEVYATYAPSVSSAKVLRRGTAFESHNVFLQLVVETGITGLLLFLIGVALAVRQVWRLPRSVRAPPLGAIIGLLVTSFFLSNFEFKYFWLVLTYATMCVLAAMPATPTIGGSTVPSRSYVGGGL